jgi:hypothetical protein
MPGERGGAGDDQDGDADRGPGDADARDETASALEKEVSLTSAPATPAAATKQSWKSSGITGASEAARRTR